MPRCSNVFLITLKGYKPGLTQYCAMQTPRGLPLSALPPLAFASGLPGSLFDKLIQWFLYLVIVFSDGKDCFWDVYNYLRMMKQNNVHYKTGHMYFKYEWKWAEFQGRQLAGKGAEWNQVIQVQWTSFENCLLESSGKPQGITVVMDLLSWELILVIAVARTRDEAWDSWLSQQVFCGVSLVCSFIPSEHLLSLWTLC